MLLRSPRKPVCVSVVWIVSRAALKAEGRTAAVGSLRTIAYLEYFVVKGFSNATGVELLLCLSLYSTICLSRGIQVNNQESPIAWGAIEL